MIEASMLKRAAQESETLRVALVRQEHVLAAQTQRWRPRCVRTHQCGRNAPV
jgi:hypothetical protein